jgi:hypothetical protein
MRKINYNSRNFLDFRSSLVNYIEQYYPDMMSDFNDASIGMTLVELNAAIGDNLSYHTDRLFQETQVDSAQEKSSLLGLARTFGLKVPGKRPSITIADFTVTLPVDGDKFDVRYAPLIRRGTQIGGGAKIFETIDDIDFASPFSSGGVANRIIIPNFDSNQNIINYKITKREVVVNGSSKVFKRQISVNDAKPFFEVILPDNDVLSIDSVIMLEGTNHSNTPGYNQFYSMDNRWFEVDALAEDKVFVEDSNRLSDNSGIRPGKWVRVDQKFITERTNNGFTKLIFGGGESDVGSLKEFGVDKTLVDRIGDFINNTSLGVTPKSGHTLFVKYRVGGGKESNIGPNVLKSVNLLDMFVNGPDVNVNRGVRQSLKVNNPLPALGGKDEPSIDEIRYLIKYNYASQNRAITVKDYLARIALMPSKFGIPFRTGVYESQNKIVVSILSLDKNGKLTNTSTDTLKENIAEYLSDYRGINDYVQIKDGKIFNLGFEIDLHIDKEFPRSEIITQAINEVSNYFDIHKHTMGDNVYLSQLIETINNINGVLNVIDIRVYNKVGEGKYSLNEVSQMYDNEETRQISVSDEFTLFGETNGMFEVKYPEVDIKVRIK